MRGRYPAGLEYVDKVDGSPVAKERARVIAELMGGELRLLEACRQLDLHETRVHQLRHTAWLWLVRAMEPGAPGRPRRRATAAAQRIRELEQALAAKELDLQQALVRAEVALIVPGRAEGATTPEKKTRRSSARLRRQKPR